MSDVVAEAAAAALGGALVVLPTDTVYGIGTRPDDPSATGRVFAAKGRPRDLELPVLVASLVSAASVAVFDGRARALAERFWPGPLTIVLPRSTGSTAWDLGGDPATVGVRQPRHRLALAVLERAGPLAVTSANRSGSPPALTCDELEATFGDLVEVYLCEEAPLVGAPSTVVDLAHGAAEILREGAVPGNDVRAALDGMTQPSAEGDG
jgi:tRNA threonylcarbamoyl adenosine modification protein (Sua5/YciO/YrdC/YwlC family)